MSFENISEYLQKLYFGDIFGAFSIFEEEIWKVIFVPAQQGKCR